MEATQVVLLVAGLVLILGTQSGLSISCHVCNSAFQYEGDSCAPPIVGKKYVQNCDSIGANYTMCRTVEQTVNGEYRMIRQCAKAGKASCVERAGTKGIKIKYCACTGNDCNTATTFTSNLFYVMVLLPILSFFYSKS
eukprot:GHVU01074650.1.p1 GENE.GHVU01074650.1~~GHVU01074650.1.p1  ORF type:complete len:138 (-),score=4.78 GHVU01074650.1:2025-2438(-)